MTLEKGNA